MAHQDGSQPKGQADVHEDDEQGHGQHDLGHDDGHIEHAVDEALALELVPLQAQGAQGADDHRDHRGQHCDDQGVPQAADEGVVLQQFAIPLCGEAVPVEVVFLIIEGEYHHHRHGDVEHGVDEDGVHITHNAEAALAPLSLGQGCHVTPPPCLPAWRSGCRRRSEAR